QSYDRLEVFGDPDAREKRQCSNDRLTLGVVDLGRRYDEIVPRGARTNLRRLALIDLRLDSALPELLFELLGDDGGRGDGSAASDQYLLHLRHGTRQER